MIRFADKLRVLGVGHFRFVHGKAIHGYFVRGPFLRHRIVAAHLKSAGRNLEQVSLECQLRSIRLIGFVRARGLSRNPRFVNQIPTHAAADYQHRKHDQDQRQRRSLFPGN